MDNQNDVALVNTVNERGLRVGEANAGAFVGVTHGTIDDTDYIEQDNQSLPYETLQYADVIFIFDN